LESQLKKTGSANFYGFGQANKKACWICKKTPAPLQHYLDALRIPINAIHRKAVSGGQKGDLTKIH
jgi:hypothetical protein